MPSPFRALTELEQRGVLVADDDSRALRPRGRARGGAPAAGRRPIACACTRSSARCSTREASDDPEALLDAGWHLLHGGDEARGAELLAETGRAARLRSERRTGCDPGARGGARGVRQAGPRRTRARARARTARAVPASTRTAACSSTYGDQATAVMQRVLGLGIAGRLRRFIGARVSTLIGLGTGIREPRVRVRPAPRGAGGFREADLDLHHRDQRVDRPRHAHARCGRARAATRSCSNRCGTSGATTPPTSRIASRARCRDAARGPHRRRRSPSCARCSRASRIRGRSTTYRPKRAR